jgi:putative salt-induced outer membrane protein YdiY
MTQSPCARALPFLICLLLAPGLALPMDVLVMKNGDRITGKIKRIWDGEVSIEPDYADEFNVDLPEVDHIVSDREFEIELTDGRELVATMGGTDTAGGQVLTADGQDVVIGLEDFLEVDEPEDYYDWEVNVDFSSTLKEGNTDSVNFQLRSDGMIKVGDHRNRAEVKFLRERLAGVSTQQKDLFTYNYNWLFKEPWFFAGNYSFERDPIQELNSRHIFSMGLGRDIWDTPHRSLSFSLGAGYLTEDIGMSTQQSSVAAWVLRFGHDFFNGDMEVFHNQDINVYLSGRSNTSYKTSTGLRYEITDLLYTNLTLNYDYETDPVPGVLNEDLALLVGFGAEFD